MIGSTAPERDETRWPAGVLVDTAEVPGGGELRLVRYGMHYEILFGEEQLMGSWSYRSEQALATIVAERLGSRARRVLIGGLGMGFTLAAARSTLPRNASIIVAELVPAVVSWARGPLAAIVGESLDDPRVILDMRDVHDVIDEARASFDAILLDVDNGPDGLIEIGNDRLYCNWGLCAARAALRDGGVLAIWSSYEDGQFADRLADAGFSVEALNVTAGSYRDAPMHTIWIAERQP